MKTITSPANASYKAWLRLAEQPRQSRLRGAALAEGLHLAQAALDAGTQIEAVIVRRGTPSDPLTELAERAMAAGAGGFELAAPLYERIAPVERGAGLMLVVAVPRPPVPARARRDMVYLDGVQDPGNAGTLLRTAAAAGIGDVLASAATAALWSPRALRAGQGAHFRLRIHEPVAAAELPALLEGPWYGADARGGEPLWSVALPRGPMGWIFGGEGAGLTDGARAACARRVSIPIAAAVESLNVAAAAAVCLFERSRRRATPQ